MTDEDDKFSLLDTYVQLLHAGARPDRDEFLAQHPELRSMLECIEALDDMAPSNEESAATLDYYADSDPETAGSNSNDLSERYELLGEIGRGGMGVVFRARQVGLDRVVALKMILAGRLATPRQIDRFLSEARSAGRLRHPHVVAIHDYGQLNGQHYIAMDHIDGIGLDERLRAGALPPIEAAQLVRTVASAVDYLHSEHVVHRDLKPSNILIDAAGRPYVTDFGLAKAFDESGDCTRSGAIVGTLAYMAPEQADGGRSAAVSPRSDIYSLGVILFEVLTGRRLFDAEQPIDCLFQVLESEPISPLAINPAIPEPLVRIYRKCIEKNPANRYPTAGDLAADLDRFLRDEEITAAPTSWRRRIEGWARNEPAFASRLAMLGLFCGIVQVAFLTSDDPSPMPQHLLISGLFVLLAGLALAFQRLAGRTRAAPYGWAAADIAVVTAILLISQLPLGPLLVAYPLLIVAAGLWRRTELVWFMTTLAIAAYIVLIAYREEPDVRPVQRLIVMTSMIAVAAMVAFQAERIRSLSRFLERK